MSSYTVAMSILNACRYKDIPRAMAEAKEAAADPGTGERVAVALARLALAALEGFGELAHEGVDDLLFEYSETGEHLAAELDAKEKLDDPGDRSSS